ncbi:MAG: efflux RND transporter permease subunit [Planctomycetes bacterium]|nr:efflux RND transporter permease subunit [Planctomycetota bacterium]
MIRFFAEHPTAANILMAILVVLGLLSVRNLLRETFPDVTPSEVEVRVIYPGATAEEVEETVVQRVEDALDGIKFIKELRAESREGFASVVAEMEDGGNFQAFRSDIQTEIDAIDDLPSDVEDPIITQLGTTDHVVSLVVSGPMTASDLKAYCEDMKDRLQILPGISLVKIRGFSDHQLRIELSAAALMRYQLSASDVARIIERQSVNLPAGILETRHRDILVRLVEERRNPQELENLIIVAGVGGGEIRLGDIAKVRDIFQEEEDKILLEGRRAGLLQIEKTKNQDTIRVAEIVKKFTKEERLRYPTVEIHVTQDISTLVVDRLQMLIRNGGQGMTLVFLTLWLFFSFRLSFWVAMSLPISFLGAFFLMPFLGLTVNMLTMIGMLLALGLLMDDGIVIAENIASHLSQGKKPMRAAVEGISEVKVGVISSFLTTVCVLGPLATIEGDIGKVLKVVPMVLILVLAVSLIEAFLILPAHLGHSLHEVGARKENRFRRRFDAALDKLRNDLFGPLLDLALRWRYLFMGCVVGLFLVSISLLAGGVIKFMAFPDLDGDVVVARVLLSPGTPLSHTEEAVDKIVKALDRVNQEFAPRQPKGQDLIQTVVVQFNQNLDAFETGPHVATITVDLLDAETRDARIDEIVAAWRAATGPLPDVLTLTFSEPSIGPGGRPIELRIQGNEFAPLQSAAAEVKEWLLKFEGVYNLSDDLRPGKPELRLQLREGAFGLGLDAETVARQLRTAFQGVTADEIQVHGESYEIDIQLRAADQSTLADLEAFYLTRPSGEQVPLSTVAIVKEGRGWSRIARVDGLRTVTVRGDIDIRVANTANIVGLLKNQFVPELQKKYPGVRFAFEGEAKETATTQQSMLRAMFVGLIGVFGLLSFQFRSYLEPLTVMLAIPLALIGVLWGHLLMGVDVSMPSMLGFASLAGIVVNDSILLVLFLKMQRDAGNDVLEACRKASRLRFRAILLTSLTTVAGLLPLLAERSLQAQVLIPLAISIAFGLMASTVLVLFVVPCLYAIFSDLGWTTTPEKISHEA